MENSDSNLPAAPPCPVDLASGVAAFELLLAGQPIDPGCTIVDLEVWQALAQPSRARLTLANSQPGASFPTGDSSDLSTGVTVTLSLGYESALTPVFAGAIHRRTLRSDINAPALLIIDALGAASDGPGTSGGPVLTLAWGDSVMAADLALEAGLKGRVRFQGSALPRPGSTVLLQGFGGPFDGEITVRECHQRLAYGLWTTELTVERRPQLPLP